jgi:hypothetical protein
MGGVKCAAHDVAGTSLGRDRRGHHAARAARMRTSLRYDCKTAANYVSVRARGGWGLGASRRRQGAALPQLARRRRRRRRSSPAPPCPISTNGPPHPCARV